MAGGGGGEGVVEVFDAAGRADDKVIVIAKIANLRADRRATDDADGEDFHVGQAAGATFAKCTIHGRLWRTSKTFELSIDLYGELPRRHDNEHIFF